MNGPSTEDDQMRAWLREPRDYASLEANRLMIARRCRPFVPPSERPPLRGSDPRAAIDGR